MRSCPSLCIDSSEFRDRFWFDIDSTVRLSCTWIHTGLRSSYGVGHLLHYLVTWMSYIYLKLLVVCLFV